jgi:bacterioferritin-associated ferredoxin
VTLSLLSRIRELRRQPTGPRTADETQAEFVCHCKHVPYQDVSKAIRRGAKTMADIQRTTSACTRCFGCRFELERMLTDAYGAAYHREATIALPEKLAKVRSPRPMYMPVLAGFRGNDVDTRVIVFNWEGPDTPIAFRADLLTLDGARVQALEHSVAPGCSVILDYGREQIGELLPDGIGVVKLILETEEVGSLRPYFQFITPTCISSTHEKKAPSKPQRIEQRKYHWIFPVGGGRRADESYLFMTNTQTTPMEGQRLVWQNDGGAPETTDLETLEFSQSACVPLHERFETLNAGEGGAVRLEPATHVVAGFMIRHEPEKQLWRVQHL